MCRVNPFRGTGVALITPMQKDGSVDYEALKNLIIGQLNNHVDFFCVLGTTAETPTLTAKEKTAIRQTVLETVNGKAPLLLGAGGNSTHAICEELEKDDFAGFDGLLMVCPYYNKPSQDGLYQHFKEISRHSRLPIVLYNVPGRTGVNLEAKTTLKLAETCENIVAIKEASGFIGQIEDIVNEAPEGFEVLSGDDAITFELLTIGAAGVISVIANAYPHEFSDMVHAALKGNYNKALEWHRKFKRLYYLTCVNGNPAGVKNLLAQQNKIEEVLRLPIVPVLKETAVKIRTYIDAF